MDFWQCEIFWPHKYEIWSEMGPYGSVGAHIKTGRSPMAQDHFKTPPDPKKGHGMTKISKKVKNILELAKISVLGIRYLAGLIVLKGSVQCLSSSAYI